MQHIKNNPMLYHGPFLKSHGTNSPKNMSPAKKKKLKKQEALYSFFCNRKFYI